MGIKFINKIICCRENTIPSAPYETFIHYFIYKIFILLLIEVIYGVAQR